jgi:hypothetical protein
MRDYTRLHAVEAAIEPKVVETEKVSDECVLGEMFYGLQPSAFSLTT